jgi:hypothetical protein
MGWRLLIRDWIKHDTPRACPPQMSACPGYSQVRGCAKSGPKGDGFLAQSDLRRIDPVTTAHDAPDDHQRDDQRHGEGRAAANRSFPPVGVYAKA